MEGENNDSWSWFLEELQKCIEGSDGQRWTLISYQQKGLLNAVAQVFPNAEHRNCARHIYANWHKSYKGDELKGLFWRAVRAFCEPDFLEAIEAMKLLNPAAVEAFIHLNPKAFCRTCTCRKWDLTGIPCNPAIVCANFLHQNSELYMHECYHKDTYMKAYDFSIPPCVGERHWPMVDFPLDPPSIRIERRRLRKNRRRDPHEDPKRPGKLIKHGIQMRCTICKSTDHNKRKCNDKDKVPSEPLAKKPRGRPRVHPVVQPQPDTRHHNKTTDPTRMRRGRGGRCRGAHNIPAGYGVYCNTDDGNMYINFPGQQGGPFLSSQMPPGAFQSESSTIGIQISSQASTSINP